MDSQGRAHCSNVLTAAFTFLGLTQVSSNFRPSVVTSARWCHHINPSMATESSPSQEPRLHKAQEPNVSHTSHPTDLHKPPPSLPRRSTPSLSHKNAAAPYTVPLGDQLPPRYKPHQAEPVALVAGAGPGPGLAFCVPDTWHLELEPLPLEEAALVQRPLQLPCGATPSLGSGASRL